MTGSIRNGSAGGIGKARCACRASLAGVIATDEAVLAGLVAHKSSITRAGHCAEARWATVAYASLLSLVNVGLTINENANNVDFLPSGVNQPVTTDRCISPSDANRASQAPWGENPWDTVARGGMRSGPLGGPAQVGNLHQTGSAWPSGKRVPYPSSGACTGSGSRCLPERGRHVQPRLVRLHHRSITSPLHHHGQAARGGAERTRLDGSHPVGRPKHPATQQREKPKQ